MLDIKGTLKGELGVKRLYLDGLDVTSVCSKCKKSIKQEAPLEYPDINETCVLDFYCEECENEWEELVKLKVEIVPV